MSIADAERFAEDLKRDKKFQAEATTKAAGLASMVELGRSRGYNFTVDELKQVARSRSKHPLTDHQLEQVAGGQGAPPDVVASVGVSTQYTAAFVSSYAVTNGGGDAVQTVAVIVTLAA